MFVGGVDAAGRGCFSPRALLPHLLDTPERSIITKGERPHEVACYRPSEIVGHIGHLSPARSSARFGAAALRPASGRSSQSAGGADLLRATARESVAGHVRGLPRHGQRGSAHQPHHLEHLHRACRQRHDHLLRPLGRRLRSRYQQPDPVHHRNLGRRQRRQRHTAGFRDGRHQRRERVHSDQQRRRLRRQRHGHHSLSVQRAGQIRRHQDALPSAGSIGPPLPTAT